MSDNDESAPKPQPAAVSISNPHCTTKDPPDRLRHGHLLLTTKDCAFETAITSTVLWKFEWGDVSSIAKRGKGGDNGLDFQVQCKGENGREEKGKEEKVVKLFWVEGLKKRDEVFSQIVGYSGIEWKVDG